MKNAFNISGPDSKTVQSLAAAVLSIMQVPHVDEKTKQLALKVLDKGVTAPTHTSISNCAVNVRGKD